MVVQEPSLESGKQATEITELRQFLLLSPFRPAQMAIRVCGSPGRVTAQGHLALFSGRRSALLDGRQHALRRHGELEQAHAGGVENGIGNQAANGDDRRNPAAVERMAICERRQFGNSHEGLSPDAAELAQAIDQYKLHHRRRFITFEEMLAVVKSLGYRR